MTKEWGEKEANRAFHVAIIIAAAVILLVLVLCPKTPAENKSLNVCRNGVCYEQQVENFKTYKWLTTQDGTKFVRIYTYDGKLVDIYGRDITIEIQKDKNVKRKK